MPPRKINSIDELRTLAGQQVGQSEWLEITQLMVDRFAQVTRDHQWIHVDRARAERDSPFGTTIAHGFLTLSLVTHLHTQSIDTGWEQKMGINYGLNRVRFANPVRVGARIRSRSVVQSVDDIDGGVQITWSITIDLEHEEKPALVAEWIGRSYQ